MPFMKIKTYAKINLTLDIVGKLPNSYHLLDSVMQSVSIFDVLNITKADKITVTCDNNEIDGKDNIAFAAASAFFDFCKIKGGCNIAINKNIPVCAGLGGGSSDAAAVIFALDKIYGTSLSENDLNGIAMSVGSDVPFCLHGGTCRISGIGEKVEKIPDIPKLYFTVIKIGKKQSTGDMYKKLDSYENLPQYTEKAVKRIIESDLNGIYECISNAFENVFDTSLQKEILSPFAPKKICLSGSGPSVYAVFDKKEDAIHDERLDDLCGWIGQIGFDKNHAFFANVFKAEDNQDLRAVSFYATGPDTTYKIYLDTEPEYSTLNITLIEGK